MSVVLAAALALSASPLGASGQPSAPPKHVGIVIGSAGHCVPWHTGMTGKDALDAVAAVQYGQQPPYLGFVIKIDGVGQNPPDDTHYWSYWHNTGSGWTYSGAGAFSYLPKPGTVEGWAYDNGASTAPRPAIRSYRTLCGAADSVHPAPSSTRPAPTPTVTAQVTPTHEPHVVTSARTPAPSTPARTPAASTPARTRAPSAVPAHSHARASAHRVSARSRSTASAPHRRARSASPAPTQRITTSGAAPVVAHPVSSRTGRGRAVTQPEPTVGQAAGRGSAAPVIATAALLAVLGAAAVAARRQRGRRT